MNDEIKEIRDKWKCYIELTKKFTTNEYEMLRVEDIEKALDYITDLQQELQEANDSIIWWRNRFKAVKRDNRELKQENERLNSQLDFIGEQNKYIDRLEKEYKNKVDEIGKLTSKIYKAIEYVNENKHLSMFADCREPEEDWNYDLECSANDLLNILQNGSEKDDR